MKKISIFTVADPEVGLGHLFRCEALVRGFQLGKNIAVDFYIESRMGAEWIKDKMSCEQFEILSWTANPGLFETILSETDLIVLDSYSISTGIWKNLNKYDRKLAVFDDYGEKPVFKGTLINGSPGAHFVEYRNEKGMVLLLGTKYQVLRQPFWKSKKRLIKDNIEKIGVIIGGTDHRDLTDRVLNVFRHKIKSDVEIIAIGRQYSNIREVKCTGMLPGESLKKIFDSLDLLITSGGQTVAEAISCKLPTVVLQTAYNQSINVQGWRNSKAVLYGGALNNEKWENQLCRTIIETMDVYIRKSLYQRMEKMKLSNSTKNVVSILSEEF